MSAILNELSYTLNPKNLKKKIIFDHKYCAKNNNNDPIFKEHCYAKKQLPEEHKKKSECHSDVKNGCCLYDLNKYKYEFSAIEIDNQQYKNFDVPGDGDCFFSCLSLVLQGNNRNGTYFRNIICNHILHNWDDWRDIVTLFHDSRTSTPQLYWTHMVNGNEWATASEIKAASTILNLNITIFMKGSAFDPQTRKLTPRYTEQTFTRPNSNQTIHLLLANSHYSVLHPCLSEIHENQVNFEADRNSASQFTVPQLPANDSCTDKDTSTMSYPSSKKTLSRKSIVKTNDENNHSIPKKRKLYNKNNAFIHNTFTYSDIDELCLLNTKESDTFQKCRRLGVMYNAPMTGENISEQKKRTNSNYYRIKSAECKLQANANDLPPPPPLSSDTQFNKVMDCIRAFEVNQKSLRFNFCKICNELRLQMKMSSNDICFRCHSDKNVIKMFSNENNMDPKSVPSQLQNLTLVEQQLISRIAPIINVHMLKHGGIAASGHCVSFPQNVNEPCKILPKLPNEIQIISVTKKGSNDTCKDFNVRRSVVESALRWLKQNNPAYYDIEISLERLSQLPQNSSIPIETIQTNDNTNNTSNKDYGPAPLQVDPGEVDGHSDSCAPLLEEPTHIREQIQNIVKEVVGSEHNPFTCKKNKVSLPWPTQNNEPLSEFTTQHFFTLAFPCLFPYALADFHMNRPRACISMSDWADHLMWFKDSFRSSSILQIHCP